MHHDTDQTTTLGRRAFLKNGTLLLAAGNLGVLSSARLFGEETSDAADLRVGLVTDLHYADKPPGGSRHYRETPKKLAEAVAQFSKDKPEFVVELGDFIDAADSVKTEQSYLKRINKDFTAICKKRHYVLGNHCVYTLTKEEFLDGVEQKRSYYSFDAGEFHFVILDSCFRGDGKPYGRKNFKWTDPNIPAAEVDWLRADLKKTSRKTIVFAHQRLDVSNHYGVKNGVEIRKIFEESGKVLAVFQGHSHKNEYTDISGIHYCTLTAMIEGSGAENNGYSTMDISPEGVIRITGHRKQKDYVWS